MRAGEGVGLEPGDVDHGPVGVQRLPAADAPLAAVVGPVQGSRDVVLLLPRPALVGPPLAALVAAALDEVQERRVGDRPTRPMRKAGSSTPWRGRSLS